MRASLTAFTWAALAAGAAAAQPGWVAEPTSEGVSSLRLQGLAPGQSDEVTVFVTPAAPGSPLAWLDARADVDARAAGQVVKASSAREGAAGGMTVFSTTRIVRERDGVIARFYILRRLDDGGGVLCRTRASAQAQALAMLVSRASSVCAAVLSKAGAAGPTGPGRPGPGGVGAAATRGPDAPAPPGGGLRPDQIAGVWFWFTQPHIVPFGGLVSDDATYLVLKDGTAYRGFDRAPADFDVAASRARSPAKWGRWAGAGDAAVFTTAQGRVDRLGKDGVVKPCRPARSGETMNQDFSATSGGSIGFGAGQTTTFSGSDLHFRQDGVMAMQSATAVGGANFGGGASRGPALVRYRLDGYTLTLAGPGGQVERRSYCRVEPGLIVVGGRRYFQPSRR